MSDVSLVGKAYHVWGTHAYHASLGACIHGDTASCLRTSLVQYFNDGDLGRSFGGRCFPVVGCEVSERWLELTLKDCF